MSNSDRVVRLARLSRAAKEAELAAGLARKVRDIAIDEADRAGMTCREIARACEVSTATVLHALTRVATRKE